MTLTQWTAGAGHVWDFGICLGAWHLHGILGFVWDFGICLGFWDLYEILYGIGMGYYLFLILLILLILLRPLRTPLLCPFIIHLVY